MKCLVCYSNKKIGVGFCKCSQEKVGYRGAFAASSKDLLVAWENFKGSYYLGVQIFKPEKLFHTNGILNYKA